MNELVLRVDQNPGFIELNFEELGVALDAKLEEYEGAVFTEETKDIAKRELANLRKLRKEFDDVRKSAKKKWMEPYDQFERNMKVLNGKIDSPISLIDSQVKDFEEKQKEEKREKISGLYQELIGDMGEYLPLEKIYESKWENATTSMKSIKESVTATIDGAKADVDTIKNMQSDAVEKALDIYKESLSISKAVTYVNEYERQKIEIMNREKEKRAREEEEQRKREIERIRAAEREAVLREERIRQEAQEQSEGQGFQIQHEDEMDTLPFVQPTTVTAFYKVVASEEELKQVEMAFNSIGIYFERRDS